MASEFQFYRVNDLTKILSVSRASIYNWLNKGTFPKLIKISDSVSVWSKSDIECSRGSFLTIKMSKSNSY